MIKKINKAVIGGGISGLAFAFYHGDSVVFDQVTKKEKEDSAFVFIQANPYTKKLLADLDLLDVRIVPVHIKAKPARQVVEEKVGAVSDDVGTDRIANVGEDMMLKVYDITERKIVEALRVKLKDQKRICEAKVERVDIDGKVYYRGDNEVLNNIKAEKIVSTIHYQIFEKIAEWYGGIDVESHDMYYTEYSADTDELLNFIDYDTPTVEEGGKGCIKVVGNMLVGKIGKDYGTHPGDANCQVFRNSRFSGVLAPPPKNVIFIGRFATANPHWRVEDSLFVAQSGYLLSEMIAEQRRFDRAVTQTSGKQGIERYQNLILHLHSEATEMLREIDWKMHANDRVPKKLTSILEEGVDIIKLALAVLHMHNYTEREIVEMFWKKSAKCWQKFLDSNFGGV